MGDTAEQVEHEVKGAVEKVAGTAGHSDELGEKGAEHLEKAEELEEAHEAKKIGIGKGSDGSTHYSWTS